MLRWKYEERHSLTGIQVHLFFQKLHPEGDGPPHPLAPH